MIFLRSTIVLTICGTLTSETERTQLHDQHHEYDTVDYLRGEIKRFMSDENLNKIVRGRGGGKKTHRKSLLSDIYNTLVGKEKRQRDF